MTTSKRDVIRIDTAVDEGGREGESPPSLLSLSISTTTTSSNLSETGSLVSPFTPRDQPLVTMTPQRREQKAREFAQKVGMVWTDLDPVQQQRAKKVQSADFTWSPNRGNAIANQRYVTTFSAEWKQFIDNLPEPHMTKLSDFSNVFFDHEAVTGYMAIRRQLSGICGSHASVMCQHYIESYRAAPGAVSNHKMLDISSFILNKIPPVKQKQYIEKGAIGMSAFELLQEFTGSQDFDFRSVRLASYHDAEHHRYQAEYLCEQFEELGPGLVAEFKVGREFLDGAINRDPILEGPIDRKLYNEVVEERDGKKANLHAMVMIGAYPDDSDGEDRYWFVLQNTHEHGYFKIVDSVHLSSCGASFYFASPETDMSLKDSHDVMVGEYAETSIDMEECASGEPEGMVVHRTTNEGAVKHN